MEFTNDKLLKINEKLEVTRRNAYFFKLLNKEITSVGLSKRYLNRAERMDSCLNLWLWDLYEQNKVLDLQKVNCCKDRFCPNCRSVAINRGIVKFEGPFKEMLSKNYNPYLLTLTVPNVHGDFLRTEIDKMSKAFTKFWKWLNKPKINGYGGFKDRYFDIMAGIKVLEVTKEKSYRQDYFHPHFHVMVFLQNDDEEDFKKYIEGGFQRKSNSYIYYSDADIHIKKLWYMAYNNISIRNYDKISNDWEDLFICDIRELEMPGGLYEVFKYTFKDTDISNFNDFKYIFNAVDGKRLCQGHGELFNLKIDDEVEDGEVYENIEEYLIIKEEPQQIKTRTVEELTTVYQDYKKISRFRNWKDIDKIK